MVAGPVRMLLSMMSRRVGRVRAGRSSRSRRRWVRCCGTCPVPCPCRPRTDRRRSMTPPAARPPLRDRRCRPTSRRGPSGAGRAAPVACRARRSACSPRVLIGLPALERGCVLGSGRLQAALHLGVRSRLRRLARLDRVVTLGQRVVALGLDVSGSSVRRGDLLACVRSSVCGLGRRDGVRRGDALVGIVLRAGAPAGGADDEGTDQEHDHAENGEDPPASTEPVADRPLRARRRRRHRVDARGRRQRRRRREGRVGLRELVVVHRWVLRVSVRGQVEVRRTCDRSADPRAVTPHRARRRRRTTRGEGPDGVRRRIGRRPVAHHRTAPVGYPGSWSGP